MSSETTEDSPRLDPIQGVLEILGRASMTGTNKLGLLLTLLDLAPEKRRDNCRISKSELADRYLDIHWEHGRPYGDVELRQTSSRKARGDGEVADDTTVMQEVRELRKLLEAKGYGHLQDKSLEVVRRQAASADWKNDWDDAIQKSLTEVERSLWKNPVSRLQRLPGEPDPFLFELVPGRAEIVLLESVAEELTRFSGVLRPLIEFQFAELVAKINRESLDAPDPDIHSHLFGRERIMPPDEIRSAIVKLQDRKCLFTGRRLIPKNYSLDHVIPWSRTRLSHIENFVMTTTSVNSRKADSLLGPELVRRWLNHTAAKSQEIHELAREHNWPTDFGRVRSIALHIYEALDPAVGVWQGEEGVQPLGINGKNDVIEMLRA